MNSTDNDNFSDFLHSQYKAVKETVTQDLDTTGEKYGDKTLIGEGAQKRVYKVHDKSCSRDVAMAVLKNNSPQDEVQFLREGRITALLQHPNIMPVYENGTDCEGLPYFTMKMVYGENLQTILDKLKEDNQDYLRKFPLLIRINIFLKVCEALAYAHSRGIIHRDLKPENIHVGEFGEVLLSDWGLANLQHDICDEEILNDTSLNEIDLKVSLKGLIKGTPGYIAPEILNSKNAYSVQSDIFALGAILHNILTFSLPLNSSSAQNCIEASKAGKIEPFASTEQTLPESLRAICCKALKVNIDERYNTVDEIITDISKYLEGFATDAEEAGFVTQLRLFYKRNRKSCNVSFVSLAIIIILGIVSLDSIRKEEQKSRLILEDLVKTYEEKEKLELELVPVYQQKARDAFLNVQLDPAMAVIEVAFNIDPENKITRELYGKMLMAKQEFDEAALLMKGVDERLFEICTRYSEIKGEKRLDHSQLLNFLKDIGTSTEDDIAYIYKNILFEEFLIEQDLQKKIELIKAELFFRNKKLKTLNMDMKVIDDVYYIDLSNNPELHTILILEKLGPIRVGKIDISNSGVFRLDALSYMKIDELHARNCGNFHMKSFSNDYNYLDAEGTKTDFSKHLENKPVKFLNIHNSGFKNYSVLLTLKNLTKLIVTKGKLPDKVRQKLRKDCVIIEK